MLSPNLHPAQTPRLLPRRGPLAPQPRSRTGSQIRHREPRDHSM